MVIKAEDCSRCVAQTGHISIGNSVNIASSRVLKIPRVMKDSDGVKFIVQSVNFEVKLHNITKLQVPKGVEISSHYHYDCDFHKTENIPNAWVEYYV